MRYWQLVGCVVLGLAAGCGEAPTPTGPAAEASVGDIEITIDEVAASPAVGGTELVQLQIEVPGMACEIACPPAVKKALAELPGVASVEVDFATKTATCQVDQSKFDAATAITGLAAIGFKDSKLK